MAPSRTLPDGPGDATTRRHRLALFKVLGDNTRYAIYLELARSPRPLTTSELADTIDLHPNTVRPHLERMREVGLIEMHSDSRGDVGRPRHRYALAADAPSLGLEPPSMPAMARMLVDLTARLGCTGRQAHEVGFEEGERRSRRFAHAPSTLEALVADLDTLGFDPIVTSQDEPPSTSEEHPHRAVVAFGNCPFSDLAREQPAVVCRLHHGMVDGMAAALGGVDVVRFGTITDVLPCHAVIGIN